MKGLVSFHTLDKNLKKFLQRGDGKVLSARKINGQILKQLEIACVELSIDFFSLL